MEEQSSDLLEKIRQQFDFTPYPRKSLDLSPKDDHNALYIHNLVTPYYLKDQRFIDTAGKLILDAGCGSGWKSLILAEANPGAQIVGVDISAESVKLARQRLQYHGFVNAEFYALSIADLPTLGMKFDYINCDEVLYLLPNRDPAIALSVFKAVLKPHGIIRANLHSSLQRAPVYRSQEIFRMMGFFDHNPTELEVGLVVETMQALKDQVDCKIRTWNPKLDNEEPQERILANHLLQGDKGFTIPDLFAALDTADLEFISMVNWRGWELRDLFKDPHQLPAFLEISLPNTPIAEQLHLFELFHPVHRLLDFWCTHPGQPETHTPLAEWQLSDWQTAHIHLHPQLQTSAIRQDLVNCIAHHQPFEISRYITLPTTSAIVVDNPISACLLPLWEHPQPFNQLVERWLRIQPCDPVTLEPVNPQAALADIKHLLQTLEAFLYVMVGQIH